MAMRWIVTIGTERWVFGTERELENFLREHPKYDKVEAVKA